MDSSLVVHQEAINAAVMQIRKGDDKWHLKPLVPVASSKLGSKAKYLFHRIGARIIALRQPPGTVADGLKIYRESIGRAYRYVDKDAESNALEIIRQVLCNPAVLAELRSRFEDVGSIFVSGALAGTLASRDQAGALELTRDIKAHTMLVMVSFLHRTYPVLLRDFLFEVFSPIVHCVHDHLFRVARVFDKTSMPSSFTSFHGFCAYIPADSQFNIPDGVSFIPLPPCTFTDTSEGGVAVALGCAGPRSHERKRTREPETMDEPHEMPARKSNRKRMNKSKTKKEKENTSLTFELHAFSTSDPIAMTARLNVHSELAFAVHSGPVVGRSRRRSSERRKRCETTRVHEGETFASTSLPANSSLNDGRTDTVGLQAGPPSRTRPGKAKRRFLANANNIASTTQMVSQVTSPNEIAAQ